MKTSNKYGQFNESNAFEMSSLINKVGCFLCVDVVLHFALSCMHLPFMKEFCEMETKSIAQDLGDQFHEAIDQV